MLYLSVDAAGNSRLKAPCPWGGTARLHKLDSFGLRILEAEQRELEREQKASNIRLFCKARLTPNHLSQSFVSDVLQTQDLHASGLESRLVHVLVRQLHLVLPGVWPEHSPIWCLDVPGFFCISVNLNHKVLQTSVIAQTPPLMACVPSLYIPEQVRKSNASCVHCLVGMNCER